MIVGNRGLGNIQMAVLSALSKQDGQSGRALCTQIFETGLITASQSVSVYRALHSLCKVGRVKRSYSNKGVRWTRTHVEHQEKFA